MTQCREKAAKPKVSSCYQKKKTGQALYRFLLFLSKRSKSLPYFLYRQKVSKKLAGHTHKIQFRTAHFTTRLRLKQV
ncbi:MAG: hypothetical protein J6C49_00450, partial [Elusimicrobiaceae bacterium]|nr:hypothetical protein [Elusimicrobiaceae bacterium]